MSDLPAPIDNALLNLFRSEAAAIDARGFSAAVDELVSAQQRRRTWMLAIAGAATVSATAFWLSGFAGSEQLLQQLAQWFGDQYGTLIGVCAILVLGACVEAAELTVTPR